MTTRIPGPNGHAAHAGRNSGVWNTALWRRRLATWASAVALAATFGIESVDGQIGPARSAGQEPTLSGSRTDRAKAFGIPRGILPMRQNDDGWRFELTPYLWAAGMDGRVGAGDRTVDVQVGFKDILEKLDGAAMLVGSAIRGRWGGGFEVLYIRLSAQRATPGPLFSDAELDAKQVMLELTGRYRLLSTDGANLDLIAGGRHWTLDNTIRLTAGVLPEIEVPLDDSWLDPIVGARGLVNLGSRWRLVVRGDVGGFDTGSDFSGQLIGVFAYRPESGWSIDAGYRYLTVDFSDELIFDVAMTGLVVGVTFSF